MFLFGYRAPFGHLKAFRLDVTAAATYTNSEINFYDGHALFIGAGGTYTLLDPRPSSVSPTPVVRTPVTI